MIAKRNSSYLNNPENNLEVTSNHLDHVHEEDSDLEVFDDEDDVVFDPNALRDNYVPFSVEHSNL